MVEIIELDRDIHPYFIACQFHPEFKSRIDTPHPLFDEFVKSSFKYKSLQTPSEMILNVA